MKIETKYNIGDKLFLMHENKAIAKSVDRIEIIIGNRIHVWYYFRLIGEDLPVGFKERAVFKTKQDLLDSL